MLKKFVIDNNAVAQEKGLEAVLAFLEAASPSISGRLVLCFLFYFILFYGLYIPDIHDYILLRETVGSVVI